MGRRKGEKASVRRRRTRPHADINKHNCRRLPGRLVEGEENREIGFFRLVRIQPDTTRIFRPKVAFRFPRSKRCVAGTARSNNWRRSHPDRAWSLVYLL